MVSFIRPHLPFLFVFVLTPSVVLTIPFSGSIFTRVSTVERPLLVRVSATIERPLSKCFANVIYTTVKKQHILHFYPKGYKAPTIQKFLQGMKFLAADRCSSTWSKRICRQPGSGTPLKVTREVKDLVEQ